jgi:hypothetical protein
VIGFEFSISVLINIDHLIFEQGFHTAAVRDAHTSVFTLSPAAQRQAGGFTLQEQIHQQSSTVLAGHPLVAHSIKKQTNKQFFSPQPAFSTHPPLSASSQGNFHWLCLACMAR